jgi:hypothetical protein
MVFGKKLIELTPEEYKVFRQAVRAASYYRNHERGKKQNRQNQQGKKRAVIKALGLPERCQRCGYDRYLGALDFHHRDPETKELNLARGGKGVDVLCEEAKKCDLLCANCHREVHAEMPRQSKGWRPRLALHPQVAAYLDAVGVSRV